MRGDIMRFERMKIVHGKKQKYDFGELAGLMNGKRKEIKSEEYYFLSGRLFEAKTDFLRDGKGKIWTILRSGNRFELIGIVARVMR